MIARISDKGKGKMSLEMLDQLANLPEIDGGFVVSLAVQDTAGFLRFMKAHGSLDLLLYEAQWQPVRASNAISQDAVLSQGDGKGDRVFDRALDAEVEAGSLAFDYRDSFTSRLRDQGELGTCWAYTASDLLGQKLCQRQPEYCGKAISVADLSQAFRDKYSHSHAGDFAKSLEYGLNNGVLLGG